MLHRCLPLALVLTGIAFITPVASQPPLPPKPPDPRVALLKLTGAKGAELDQAVRGVAAYPPRTRQAILDLAHFAQKYPALLADLAKLRAGPAEAIDRYLTSNKYEPELQHAAALVLVEAPETVDRMSERPDLVRIVGIAWSTPPGKQLISAVLDSAAANQEKTRTTAADRWAARLKADPALMKQYSQLLDDYTRRTTAVGTKPDDTWKSYGYGMYRSPEGYVIDDVPSPEVIKYALALGTQYQAVAMALIQQYLNGGNQDDYNAAVGGWYNANGSSIPQSTRQDNSDYYDLLQELARLADAASASGSGDGSGSGTDSGNNSGSGSGNSGNGNTVNNVLAANPKNYPRLTHWTANNPAPKLGSLSDLPRLKNGPGDTGKPPITGKLPFDPVGGKDGPGKTPSTAPFAERLKATAPDARARSMPQGAQNPFSVAGRSPMPASKPGVGANPGGTPHQLYRGTPSMGHSLSRAQGHMNAAWRPRGGAGPRPSGGPKK